MKQDVTTHVHLCIVMTPFIKQLFFPEVPSVQFFPISPLLVVKIDKFNGKTTRKILAENN